MGGLVLVASEEELRAVSEARVKWARRVAVVVVVVCALGFAYFYGFSNGILLAQELMVESLARDFQASVVPNFSGLP